MLRVALGGLLGDPLGGKEGRRGAKIGSTSRRKGSMALEKGCFKCIGWTKNLIGGTRSWSVCVGW